MLPRLQELPAGQLRGGMWREISISVPLLCTLEGDVLALLPQHMLRTLNAAGVTSEPHLLLRSRATPSERAQTDAWPLV